MDHTKKTLTYAATAIVLALLAWALSTHKITPEAFLDQGQEFYPQFTDPNAATTLEVVEFDQESGSPRPFKVTLADGRWTIPSHYDYPADGKDRLARTAAGLIGVKKEEFRSDNVADHESFGLIDPMDETAALSGRGRRVTIKADDNVLADYIIGLPVEGRSGFYYVRVPGQNRVYSARLDVELSTAFSDWIEADLLKIAKHKVRKLVFKDYSIDERTRSVNQRDVITLSGKNYEWSADRMPGGKKLDSAKVQTLLGALEKLSIVGVRPKPAGLSGNLKVDLQSTTISQNDILSLQSRGFYFSRDGNLLSNEGELQVATNEGIRYTLRFGEVAYGRGEAVSAGMTAAEQAASGPAENRFLLVTTEFDRSLLSEPEQATNKDFMNKPDSLWTEADRENRRKQTEYNQWSQNAADGQKRSDELNTRFAGWYYVISAESFDKLHLKRSDLQVNK
jgi:hypothetical protein